MDSVSLKNMLYDFSRAMNNGIDNVFMPILSQHGLTPMQARLLFELNRCGEMSVGQVGRFSCENSGNSSTLCKRMERAGLLSRRRSVEDERRVVVRLTEQGVETVQRITEEIDRHCAPVLEQMTEGQFSEIEHSIQVLLSLLAALAAGTNENMKEGNTKNEQ